MHDTFDCSKLSRSNKKGFTLLELLIVIAIIAILSVILILVLDPAETLKKSRDSQRIADLNTVKTAIGIFTTTTSTPNLGGTTAALTNANCKTGSGAGTYPTQTATVRSVWYSIASSTPVITASVDSASSSQVASSTQTLTDGTGWIPVNLDQLTGGSPVSNFPLDPTNSITAAGPSSADLAYRYTCNASTTKWEADTVLESNTYAVIDNKMTKDGGNNINYYEIGTDVKLLGTGTNF